MLADEAGNVLRQSSSLSTSKAELYGKLVIDFYKNGLHIVRDLNPKVRFEDSPRFDSAPDSPQTVSRSASNSSRPDPSYHTMQDSLEYLRLQTDSSEILVAPGETKLGKKFAAVIIQDWKPSLE